jgi:regulator of sigma E protease
MSIPGPLDLLYFLVALAILITVHELGHFLAARWLGVKCLRFSIGFGRPLLRYQRHPDATEYVIALIPLGGYVKMLDEREDPVDPAQGHLAFNRQAVWKRFTIVAAGPLFNFLFAVLAYWAVFVGGESGLPAVIGEVEPDSVAAAAGFRPGDQLLRIGNRDAALWESAAFDVMARAPYTHDLPVTVRDAAGVERERLLPAARLALLPEDAAVLAHLGLKPRRPPIAPVIGKVVAGEPAEQAGLRAGDRILAAADEPVDDWDQWVERVQASPGRLLAVEVERDGRRFTLNVTPREALKGEATVGRIGAEARVPRVSVQRAPLPALRDALLKTADMTWLTVRVVARMVVGAASLDNLGGPIAIAKAAGQTANTGIDTFVKFLAVVSISLGVLNLLPIPILDGGHLVYFLIEWVKGSPPSENAQLLGQKFGILVLAALMGLAFYLDLSRLFG